MVDNFSTMPEKMLITDGAEWHYDGTMDNMLYTALEYPHVLALRAHVAPEGLALKHVVREAIEAYLRTPVERPQCSPTQSLVYVPASRDLADRVRYRAHVLEEVPERTLVRRAIAAWLAREE